MSGLEVFSSIDNYNGEYVNWGDAFSYVNQLTSDPDYTVSASAADPHIDALVNAPQTSAGQWMRYHTDTGEAYNGTTAPTSANSTYRTPSSMLCSSEPGPEAKPWYLILNLSLPNRGASFVVLPKIFEGLFAT